MCPSGAGARRVGFGRSLYVCPTCGNREYRAGVFEAVPEEERAYKGQERRLPEVCGLAVGDGSCPGEMVWTPESSAHDLLHEDFEVDLGDGSGPRRIRSLSELRSIEHDSERRSREDPKAAPLVWRDFSQDRSNRDVNSLAGTQYDRNRPLRPAERRTSRGRLPITARRLPGGFEG